MEASSAPAIQITTNPHLTHTDPRATIQRTPPLASPNTAGIFDFAAPSPRALLPSPIGGDPARQIEPTWEFNNNPNWQGFRAEGRPDAHMAGQSKPKSARVGEAQELDPSRKASMAFMYTLAQSRDTSDTSGSVTPNEECHPGTSPNYRYRPSRHAYSQMILIFVSPGSRVNDTSASAHWTTHHRHMIEDYFPKSEGQIPLGGCLLSLL